MANVGYTASILTTQQTVASTTYTDVPGLILNSGSFITGDVYLIWGNAWFSENNTTANVQMRTTQGGLEISGSVFNWKPSLANGWNAYTFFTVITGSSASGQNVTLQGKIDSVTAGKLIQINQGCIFAMHLKDLKNSDYIFVTGSTSQSLSSSVGIVGAQATFTPNGTDDWMALGQALFAVGSIGAGVFDYISLLSESVGATSLPETRERPAAISQSILENNCRVYKALSNVAHTITVQGKGSAAPGAHDFLAASSLFLLRLNAFQDHTSSYVEPALATIPVGAAYSTSMYSASYQPTNNNGDNIVFSTWRDKVGNFANVVLATQMVDSVDQPGGITTAKESQSRQAGSSDEADIPYLALVNLTNTNHFIQISGSSAGAAAVTAQQGTIVAFSMALAGGAAVSVPHRYHRSRTPIFYKMV